jgi:DNA-binding MurR/RpiR family transcriptional regulator
MDSLAARADIVQSAPIGNGMPRRLSRSAKALSDYVEQYPNAVLVSSATELAERIGASDATVIRAIQSLGYRGLPHLKSVIAAQLDAGTRSPLQKVSVTVDALLSHPDRSPFAMTAAAYGQSLEWLRHSDIERAIAAATAELARARRIVLYGPGPTFQLVDQTAVHLNRIGRRASSLPGGGEGFADTLLHMEDGDALLMLAYGRVTPEATLATSEVRRRQGAVVVITDNPSGRLAAAADIVIAVPRTSVGNMTMYGMILMVLECLVLSLTREGPELALAAAARLRDLRSPLLSGE